MTEVQRKPLIWGIAYSFKGLVYNYHSGRQAGMILEYQLQAKIWRQQAGRKTAGLVWTFETSVTHILQQDHMS